MTRMSSSAARQAGASCVRWGVTDAAVVIPASFIWRMRSVTSSGRIGSLYICCMRAVAFSSSSSRISSKRRSGPRSGSRGPRGSRRPAAQLPSSMAVRAHHAVHGRAEHRQLELVGVDLPGDVDVSGSRVRRLGDDGDVVEPVGLSPDLKMPISISATCPPSGIRGAGTATVHTGMSIANAGPTRRRSPTLLARAVTPGRIRGFQPDPSPAPGGPRRGRPAPAGTGRGPAVSPAGRRTTRSSSWIIRAVAPQIISPSTSKNHTPNDPSALPGTGLPGSSSVLRGRSRGRPDRAGRRRRPARPRPGWPPRGGGDGHGGHQRNDERRRHHRHDRVDPPFHGHLRRGQGDLLVGLPQRRACRGVLSAGRGGRREN